MAEVKVIAVEHDVSDKLDTTPIIQELQEQHIVLLYTCTNDDSWQDEQWDESGQMHYVIKLPYQKVKRMKKENVSKLMLRYARERLAA